MAQPDTNAVGAAAGIQTITRGEVEAARRAAEEPATEGYTDRFMTEDAALPVVAPVAGGEAAAPVGVRSWVLETRAGTARSSSTGQPSLGVSEWGLRALYRWETLNHGAWVLEADGRSSHGDTESGLVGFGWYGTASRSSGERLRFSNLAFPVTAGWLADSWLGDGHGAVTYGLSRQQRLSLGTREVRGVATRWYRPGTEWRLGWGQRGEMAGGPYPGFERSGGQYGWLGATHELGPTWYVAGQLGLARDVLARHWGWRSTADGARQDITSAALALGRGLHGDPRDGQTRWRLSLLGSQVRGSSPGASASGLHFELQRAWGRYLHTGGLHWAQPNLYFADQPLLGGERALFWRVDYSGARLGWGGGVDIERNRAGAAWNLPAARRTSLYGNVRYRLRRDTMWGGTLRLSQLSREGGGLTATSARNRSLYAYGYYQTRFGSAPRSRLSAAWRRNQRVALGSDTATGYELQWEQDWIGGRWEAHKPEFTTTLGYAWDRSGERRRRYPTAGLRFRRWFSGRSFVAGNLRYSSVHGNLSTSRGLSGMLQAEHELRSGWRVGAQVALNQARTSQVPVPGWDGPAVYRTADRSVYLYLRWEGSKGRDHGIKGQVQGFGAGRISGRVFLDANGDGVWQPDEAGVDQVEVVLNGRYRTRTGADGRFEFGAVAVGAQELSLVLDSVPLPWQPGFEGGQRIEVPLRGTAVVELPLQQLAP